MLFSEIHPFVRYVYFLHIYPTDVYAAKRPLDNRLFFMYSGTSEISVEDKTYTLSDGDALIIPSGFKYRLMSPNKKATCIGVNFDYTKNNASKSKPIGPIDAKSFIPSMQLEVVNFSDLYEFNSEIFIKNANSVTQKFLDLESEYSCRLLHSDLTTSCILTEILTAFLRMLREKDKNDETFIRILLDYVKKNMSKPLSNADVAAAFNMHPNYVSSLVKNYTGMPLHKYLLHLRIRRALDLLGHDVATVSEIAERCGFVDIYHFSKAFKKIVGVCPSKYK